MSQLSFDEYERADAAMSTSMPQGNGDRPRIGFFSLKNDGDEAIVRIMHDSTKDFDMLNVHRVTIDGKSRNVSCNRTASEPASKCPLCEAKSPISKKIYIHLIEYVRGEDGSIIPTPKVWERSASYAYKLRDYINDYGPLSECLFKIKRKGAAGSRDTDYNFIYCRPDVYKAENYPTISDAFNGYQADGAACMHKDFEGLKALANALPINTAETAFPTAQETPVAPTAREAVTPVNSVPWESTTPARAPMNTANAGYDMPMNRPRRTF